MLPNYGIKPKTLILCFDGTTNTYCSKNTNVVKLCGLFKKKEFEGKDQMIFYQPGVGTWFSPGVVSPLLRRTAKLLDMAFAWYLGAHVMDGYRFLMQNYQDGDRICIFGFSRGAYTARCLAAFLNTTGLLPRDNHEHIPFAYNLYKNDDPSAQGFKDTFCREVTIDFLGLWDTVSSVGVIMSRSLPNTNKCGSVKVFRHALALDERRVKFSYHDLDGPMMTHSEEATLVDVGVDDHATVAPVKEVWFAGCHTDVGGGNTENSKEADGCLSNVSLRWMVKEVVESGIQIEFNEEALKKLGIPLPDLMAKVKSSSLARVKSGAEVLSPVDAKDALAAINDSLGSFMPTGWFWWLMELFPAGTMAQGKENRWIGKWRINFGRPRVIESYPAKFHISVRERMRSLNYAPKARVDEDQIEYVA